MVKLKQRAYSVLIACLTAIMVVVFAIGALLVPPKTTTALAAEQTKTETLSVFGTTGTLASDSSISWTSGGVTFTNDKGSSTTAIRTNDSDHYRVYANSNVTISAPGNITEIVITCTSSSYANACEGSFGDSATVSGSTVTITPTNSSESVTATATAQIRLKTVAVTYTVDESGGGDEGGETPAPTCEHTNLSTENVTYEQKDNNQHTVTATCLDCSETVSETVDCDLIEGATSYECVCGRIVAINTITLSVNGTVLQETLKTDKNQKVTLPTPSETFENYTFYAWVEKENATELPTTVYKAGEATFTETKTLYALYMNGEAAAWNLVTDASTLAAGNQIVIAAAADNYALSTTQKTNNRGAAAITKDGNTATINDDVQVLTLEVGTVDGTFAFNTGSGYLYAASSGSNHLKTQTTNNDNGSWEITIDNTGVASIVAKGSYTRNVMQYNYNNGSPLFACYASASQDAVAIYKKSGGEVNYTTTINTTCQHENTVTDEKAATCTEDGYKVVTCTNPECNTEISRETYSALGHEWDEGEVTTIATCQQKQVKTYTCATCGGTKTEEGEYGEHDYVENVCTVCGKVDPLSIDYSGTYYLVGYKAENNYLYLQNKLGTYDYYKGTDSGVTTLDVPQSIAEDYANYIFRIVKNEDGTYSIYDGDDGKLFNKDFSIVSVGETVVQIYNGEDYFSINKSLFDRAKLYSSDQIRDIILIPYEEIEDPQPSFESASLILGKSLNLKFFVTVPDGYATEDLEVEFTMGTISQKVKVESLEGRYFAIFEGIAPQFMGDTITATLMLGEETLLTMDYSVVTYAKNKLADESSSNELKQLLADLLAYGAAAQEYKDYNAENLVNVGYESLAGTATPDEAAKYVLTTEEGAAKIFAGANVWFDNVNKIYVRLATTENVTLKVNEAEVQLNGDVYYTEEILATGFDTVYTFEVYVDGVLQQTLTYSINSYVYSKKDSATMGRLATALYNYGLSAEAYAAANGNA